MGDIINASAVTAYFGFPSSDLAVLSGMCNRVCNANGILAGICNRPLGFLSAAQVEYFNGDWNDRFVLTYTPISATPAPVITSNDQTVSTDVYTIINSSGIVGMKTSASVLWQSGAMLSAYPPNTRMGWPNFGEGFQVIEATYTGGYGATPIPGALTQAALELVGTLYRRKSRDPTLQSETLGDYAYTTAGNMSWPDFIQYLKDTYLAPGGLIRHNLM